MTNTTPAVHRLDGKLALVTGGGRGIGRMITAGLLDQGARVVISSRKRVDLDATVSDLAPRGNVSAFVADLSTEQGVQDLAAHVQGLSDELHVLVNNAGANWGAGVDDFPASAWDRVLSVNVTGVFGLTQALLPQLRAASTDDDPARVINIGSIDGLRAPGPGINNFSYSASKAGVHMVTQHLATTLAPRILVNAIAPGPFETKMTEVLMKNGREALEAHVPLRRIGRPADITGTVEFLTGPGSTYITGVILPLDGGIVVGR
ncbi:SDR family NAD(P)-dependent oxidoreductase [Tomitella fengzijianii]|uniref:SDR family NAD(P)-dependent oxidoreductase n=1 Tax=Tomitella fengzijianii TaxID=2597660 RepID=UPI00131B22F3|nr:SDR family NAD(P)-dependent oxidoreductase [Tomitella fengzijianii]